MDKVWKQFTCQRPAEIGDAYYSTVKELARKVRAHANTVGKVFNETSQTSLKEQNSRATVVIVIILVIVIVIVVVVVHAVRSLSVSRVLFGCIII